MHLVEVRRLEVVHDLSRAVDRRLQQGLLELQRLHAKHQAHIVIHEGVLDPVREAGELDAQQQRRVHLWLEHGLEAAVQRRHGLLEGLQPRRHQVQDRGQVGGGQTSLLLL